MSFEERQGEVDGLRQDADGLVDALDNAESCETVRDFNANLDEAIETAERLLVDLKELRGRT